MKSIAGTPGKSEYSSGNTIGILDCPRDAPRLRWSPRKTNALTSKQPESATKPYQTSQLKIYGDITVLTGAVVTMGALNDHTQGPDKTS